MNMDGPVVAFHFILIYFLGAKILSRIEPVVGQTEPMSHVDFPQTLQDLLTKQTFPLITVVK